MAGRKKKYYYRNRKMKGGEGSTALKRLMREYKGEAMFQDSMRMYAKRLE
jgi:hypothetical protein